MPRTGKGSKLAKAEIIDTGAPVVGKTVLIPKEQTPMAVPAGTPYYSIHDGPTIDQGVTLALTALQPAHNTDPAAHNARFAEKQDTLVSGVNIKTINGVSLLGAGDIVIGGGGGTPGDGVQSDWNEANAASLAYVKNKPQINGITLQGNRILPETPLTNMQIAAIMAANRP